MKKVSIFGSTGSIGRNSLDVIKSSKKKFKIAGLCTYGNIPELQSQIREFRPDYVCVVDEDKAKKIKEKTNKKIKIFSGRNGLNEFASISSDISIMAISGIECLRPLLANIKRAKRVALANKESIVAAGSFVFSQAKKFNTQIIPVDSEINALFQLFQIKDKHMDRVYITASGGALRKIKAGMLKNVKVGQVLAHPTWDMGKRITVDSATLINKGFEVIETHNFFNIPYEDIGIVIHRESTIHALVQFIDKTVFACLYPPNMKIPISSALFHPKRSLNNTGIDFKKRFSLSFEPINYKKYPLLKIILDAASKKDNALTILNACDEVAIDYFLRKKIGFSDIFRVVENMFKHYPSKKVTNVGEVYYWDNWAREKTKEFIHKNCCN